MRQTTHDFLQSVQDQVLTGTSVEMDVMVKANFIMLSELLKQFKQQQQDLFKLQRQVEKLQRNDTLFYATNPDEDAVSCKEEEETLPMTIEDHGEEYLPPPTQENCEDKSSNFWHLANCPETLSQYLDAAKGFDPELTLASTQRGEDLLIYKGFSYHKKGPKKPSVLEDGRGIIKWRCSKHHKRDNCRGQLATTSDGLCVLRESVTKHNHGSDESDINGVLLRERIKEMVTNHPTMKTMDILASAELLFPSSSTKKLREDRSLHRFIQRIKAKQTTLVP